MGLLMDSNLETMKVIKMVKEMDLKTVKETEKDLEINLEKRLHWAIQMETRLD